jgi:hypothetical protein
MAAGVENERGKKKRLGRDFLKHYPYTTNVKLVVFWCPKVE